MTEFREDVTTGDIVLVAPERDRRPHASEAVPPPAPAPCPFCPGNEDLTPPETWRLAREDGGWLVRAFPNRFPLVADGAHEVIVESPRHDWDLASGSAVEVRNVLVAYRARHRALSGRRPALIVIFRNHGRSAGTSLQHPHSQVVALPLVPPLTRRRFEVARRWYDDHGACLYQALAESAGRDGRVVTASEVFTAHVPRAASVRFETWITPRRRHASIAEMTEADLDDLATILGAVLRALAAAAGEPAYNLIVDGAPAGVEAAPSSRWQIRVVPRLAAAAGFELATGIPVNPGRPEADAELLRGALASR